ncbi:MAG: hypothetical protein KDE54_18070 [Caldilineaceae bacterium]|nr:hypothetical protein [Caldilineaceae bacterium]MCB0089822.1 hypothetical protein [Caldilineaceae bacterium]MCB0096982.1 hypothetical protein [Caldilineaceae bacterium]MCB9150567.1 hypothetical protein [Caldilineaceae bacterium]
MVKLLMQWDIKIGREQDFSEFMVREFAPRLMKLGIEPTEILYTMYGEGPQMYASVVVDSRERLLEVMQNESWKRLQSKLQAYVINYTQKIVADSGRFQM